MQATRTKSKRNLVSRLWDKLWDKSIEPQQETTQFYCEHVFDENGEPTSVSTYCIEPDDNPDKLDTDRT